MNFSAIVIVASWAALAGYILGLRVGIRAGRAERDHELRALRRQCEGHADRIAAQSELLSRRAERGGA